MNFVLEKFLAKLATLAGWNIDIAKFVETLSRETNQRQDAGTYRRTVTESLVHSTMRFITVACHESAPKKEIASPCTGERLNLQTYDVNTEPVCAGY